MTTGATEPNGWELKRSLDQMREDFREDLNELKTDVNGIGNKIDAKFDDLERRFPTRSDHNALVARVDTLEEKADKRSDRSLTIWIAIGASAAAGLTAIGTSVIGILANR